MGTTKRNVRTSSRWWSLAGRIGAVAALALAACDGGSEMKPGHGHTDGGLAGAAADGSVGDDGAAGSGGSAGNAGSVGTDGGVGTGGSGGAPPNPDGGLACGPVMAPLVGLDPNNQVNPGPLPGDAHFNFDALLCRGEALRPIMDARQEGLLDYRYDLSDRPSPFTMTRGKPLQQGVRVRLPSGLTWADLAALSPDEIKARDLFPGGFMPLPHPNQDEGGMVLPQSSIDEIDRQTARRLQRFDIDFDIPEIFLAEFPPAIFLTTRKDLGDVSQGQLLTFANFFELMKDKLNEKQLDGLRLLLTPFPQQQFNLTDDRRTVRPVLGIACLECHINGHTNGATHLVQDIRPQEMRNRVDTPTLRGVNIQRLFGSQRALKTVEDFTEFEQSGAYFDGDMASAKKKGLNMLDRTQEVQPMAEVQELFDFPPAPKLNAFGTLDAGKATSAELRGEIVFNGKGQCVSCHQPPFYTDLTMHDLMVERFFAFRSVNNQIQKPDGPIKTFPLRGIKESPPYFHDGRLLTLEDTIEFFNLILEDHLTQGEKDDLLAFLLAL
jgi:cytochrome c peroxidase